MQKVSMFFLSVAVLILGYTVNSSNRVAASEPASCIVCHQPDILSATNQTAFSARMHLTHLLQKEPVDCLACHSWSAGLGFGLQGIVETWGATTKEEFDLIKEISTSWATSGLMDNRHAQALVSCADCHGKKLPGFDASVENKKCLECHGPMEELEKKTEPAEFKDRNPHRSHLGEINCTVCHKAHNKSINYCLGCHQQFLMKIPGEGKPKLR